MIVTKLPTVTARAANSSTRMAIAFNRDQRTCTMRNLRRPSRRDLLKVTNRNLRLIPNFWFDQSFIVHERPLSEEKHGENSR